MALAYHGARAAAKRGKIGVVFDEPIERLCELAARGDVAVLSGAGLSTESGIPDYRSPEALARGRRPIQGPEFIRSETARRRYWRGR